jgi:hypothetical protein
LLPLNLCQPACDDPAPDVVDGRAVDAPVDPAGPADPPRLTAPAGEVDRLALADAFRAAILAADLAIACLC